MSNRDPDSQYGDLVQSLDFFFDQKMKDIHTAMPGRIVSYTAEKKRAIVSPAIDILLTNGRRMKRAALVDIPVIHPSGGGFVVHIPLVPGDSVMLVFSERGLSRFKESFDISPPELGVFFNMKDGVAFPGFGGLEISPATDGLCIQTEAGDNFLSIKENDIVMETPGTIRLRANSIRMEQT